MTYEEAYKILTHEDEYGLIKATEAIGKATEAVEKQIPKKPIPQYSCCDIFPVAFLCPSCEIDIIHPKEKFLFCVHCGQKIDWSDA